MVNRSYVACSSAVPAESSLRGCGPKMRRNPIPRPVRNSRRCPFGGGRHQSSHDRCASQVGLELLPLGGGLLLGWLRAFSLSQPRPWPSLGAHTTPPLDRVDSSLCPRQSFRWVGLLR